MKITATRGKDLNDNVLEQLMYLECDALAYYESLDSDKKEFIIGAIPVETLKQFKRRMANTLFLMRIEKQNIVGMACLSKKGRKNNRYLHTVYVRPSYRGKGIGKALVNAAMSIAKKNSLCLSLGVNPLNKVAVHLYESCGFSICKEQSITMDFDGAAKA